MRWERLFICFLVPFFGTVLVRVINNIKCYIFSTITSEWYVLFEISTEHVPLASSAVGLLSESKKHITFLHYIKWFNSAKPCIEIIRVILRTWYSDVSVYYWDEVKYCVYYTVDIHHVYSVITDAATVTDQTQNINDITLIHNRVYIAFIFR